MSNIDGMIEVLQKSVRARESEIGFSKYAIELRSGITIKRHQFCAEWSGKYVTIVSFGVTTR